MSFETDCEDKNAELETDFRNKNAESIDFIVKIEKQKTSFENKNFEAIVVKSETLIIKTNLLKKLELICDSKMS